MFKKKVATIILNRNLPIPTNNLYEHLKKYDEYYSDIFVVESGSDHNNLSKYCNWHANSEEVMANGLRYSRGMNYGLVKLLEENKFDDYEAFFLLCNDVELPNSSSLSPLLELFNKFPRLGLVSPCSKNWGELSLLKEKGTLCFWFIYSNAYLIRKEFMQSICNFKNPNFMNFLFDGSNFRGYGLEHEIVAKGYINNWASAITNKVLISENETYLLNQSDLIKTDPFQENLKLYLEEGKKWMLNKYGFRSHWAMQQYSKCFYDLFFDTMPSYDSLRLY